MLHNREKTRSQGNACEPRARVFRRLARSPLNPPLSKKNNKENKW